jgi:hypothetical protein
MRLKHQAAHRMRAGAYTDENAQRRGHATEYDAWMTKATNQ